MCNCYYCGKRLPDFAVDVLGEDTCNDCRAAEAEAEWYINDQSVDACDDCKSEIEQEEEDKFWAKVDSKGEC